MSSHVLAADDGKRRLAALQRTVGNRAVASLIDGRAAHRPAVEVDNRPPSLSVPASLAERAMKQGSVEFGHSSDPTRTLEQLGREAVELPGARASWRQATLVLSGVDPARIDSSSEPAFARSLRESLPFRRFRLLPDAGGLALEGKLNPWVRLYQGRVEILPPGAVPPAHAGWQWVAMAPEPLQDLVAPFATIAANRHTMRSYVLPWLSGSLIVLPVKLTRYPNRSRPFGNRTRPFAGGLPALVGGWMEEGESAAGGARREMQEELPRFAIAQPEGANLSAQFGHYVVDGEHYHLGHATVVPRRQLAGWDAADPLPEMRGWVIIDITQLGVLPTSSLEAIAGAIASCALARLPIPGDQHIEPKQLAEFFAALTTRWMAEAVRGQLQTLYDAAVAQLWTGGPPVNGMTPAARWNYFTAVGRLSAGQPIWPDTAAIAADAHYRAAILSLSSDQTWATNPAAQAAHNDYTAALHAMTVNLAVAPNPAAQAARDDYLYALFCLEFNKPAPNGLATMAAWAVYAARPR
jgi:ADP-ribose pyrophosphatase YjhB (NUDIX family)